MIAISLGAFCERCPVSATSPTAPKEQDLLLKNDGGLQRKSSLVSILLILLIRATGKMPVGATQSEPDLR